MARTFEEDCVVLKSVDYRDSDRIVTLYSRGRGRLSAIARGARASRRRFSGSLEPFCEVRVELAESRNLSGLRSARVTRGFPALLSSLERIGAAGEATVFVRELTVDAAPEPRLFDALLAMFEGLAPDRPDAETLLLAFETRALSLVGLAPSIDLCLVSGARRTLGQAAYFDPARGGIVRRELLGAALRSALPMSGGSLERMRESATDAWVPATTWSAEEQSQVRRALTSFREAHVRQTS